MGFGWRSPSTPERPEDPALLKGVQSLLPLLHLPPGCILLQEPRMKTYLLQPITSPIASRISCQGEESPIEYLKPLFCSLTAILCPCLAQLAKPDFVEVSNYENLS